MRTLIIRSSCMWQMVSVLPTIISVLKSFSYRRMIRSASLVSKSPPKAEITSLSMANRKNSFLRMSWSQILGILDKLTTRRCSPRLGSHITRTFFTAIATATEKLDKNLVFLNIFHSTYMHRRKITNQYSVLNIRKYSCFQLKNYLFQGTACRGNFHNGLNVCKNGHLSGCSLWFIDNHNRILKSNSEIVFIMEDLFTCYFNENRFSFLENQQISFLLLTFFSLMWLFLPLSTKTEYSLFPTIIPF